MQSVTDQKVMQHMTVYRIERALSKQREKYAKSERMARDMSSTKVQEYGYKTSEKTIIITSLRSYYSPLLSFLSSHTGLLGVPWRCKVMFRLQCLYLMFPLPGTAPDSHMAYPFTSSLCSLIIISKIVTLYLSLPFRYTTSSTLIFLHSTYHLVKYYLFYLFSLLPSFTGSLFSLLFVPNIMNIVCT